MKYLDKPFCINSLQLVNRLVIPPLDFQLTDDGYVSEKMLGHYDEITRGKKVGLCVVEHAYVASTGKMCEGQLSVSRDSDVPGLSKLAEVLHNNNAKCIVEIDHGGSACSEKVTGSEIVGPSACVNPSPFALTDLKPRVLTQNEIAELICDFREAARRVKEAGFDGVEIHACHGYLLNQFYSPLTNRRYDKYGGNDVKKRIRIIVEIIDAIRAVVGDEFLIAIRLGASDYTRGGSTESDTITAVKEFVNRGVGLIDISGGMNGWTNPFTTDNDYNRKNNMQGYFRRDSQIVKQNVNVPVILTGGIVDGCAAEQLIADGYTDLVGVGRAMLKNPNWIAEEIESKKSNRR